MRRYLVLLLAPVLAGTASATTLVNGSFETPNLGVGNYSYATQPDGWTGTGALVNAQGASAWYGATPPAGQDGAQFYALQATTSIFQNFVATRSGRLVVSWLAAGRPNFGSYAGDQTYDVSLTGSGIEMGSLGTFATTSGQAFAHETGAAIVRAGEIYSLTFRGLSPADETAFIDGVSVATVPEPATWALMIGGFAMIGAARRRSRAVTA